MPSRKKSNKAPAALLTDIDILCFPLGDQVTESGLQSALSHVTLFSTPTSVHIIEDAYLFRLSTISADALANLGDPALGIFLRAYHEDKCPDNGLPCATFQEADLRSPEEFFCTTKAVESILAPPPAVLPMESQLPSPPAPPLQDSEATPRKRRVDSPTTTTTPCKKQLTAAHSHHSGDSDSDSSSNSSTISRLAIATSDGDQPMDLIKDSASPEPPFQVQEHQRRKYKLATAKARQQPRALWPIPGYLRPRPSPAQHNHHKTILARPTAPGVSLHKVTYTVLVQAFSAIGQLKDVRAIRGGGLALDFPPEADFALLEAISTIADLPARCDLPASTPCRSAVIGGVPIHLSEDFILQDANSQAENLISIRRVQRLGRRDDPSRTVKIVFNGDSLPDVLHLDSRIHPVQVFIAKPRQCQLCQRFFHSKENCHSTSPRCRNCGNSHDLKDCEATTSTCINCGGPHQANDSRCPSHRDAQEVARLQSTANISMFQARERLFQKKNAALQTTTPPVQPASLPPTTTTTSAPVLSTLPAIISTLLTTALSGAPSLLHTLTTLVTCLASSNPDKSTIINSLTTLGQLAIQLLTTALTT